MGEVTDFEAQLVDIVQQFMPGATVTEDLDVGPCWSTSSSLDAVVTVRLGVRAAFGPWGARLDGARVAAAKFADQAGWGHDHVRVVAEFTPPAAIVVRALHAGAALAERLLS